MDHWKSLFLPKVHSTFEIITAYAYISPDQETVSPLFPCTALLVSENCISFQRNALLLVMVPIKFFFVNVSVNHINRPTLPDSSMRFYPAGSNLRTTLKIGK